MPVIFIDDNDKDFINVYCLKFKHIESKDNSYAIFQIDSHVNKDSVGKSYTMLSEERITEWVKEDINRPFLKFNDPNLEKFFDLHEEYYNNGWK